MEYKGLVFDGSNNFDDPSATVIREFVNAVEALLGRVPTQKELAALAMPFVVENMEEGWAAAFNMSSQG